MKKEAFQEIAKHFAESINVRLKFQKGATPSTNGTEIVLPTEMSEEYLDETLGALLHETNHIRYTDFNAWRNWDDMYKLVGNTLEDIRIDNKALMVYPNSRCFYMSLVDDVISRCKDKLLAEPLPIKVLKALILNSVGVDLKTVYGEHEDFQTIEEKANKLQGTINEVIMQCEKTADLEPYIAKVIKEVFGDLPEKEKQQEQKSEEGDGQGQGKSQSNQGQSAGGNGIPSIEESSELFNEFAEAIGQEGEILEDISKIGEELQSINKEYKSASRSGKSSNTRANTIAQTARSEGRNLTQEETEKIEELKDKAQAKLQEARDQAVEFRKKESEYYQKKNEFNSFRAQLKDLRNKANKILNNGFSKSDDCNLLGFNALDNEKLVDKDYVEVQYNPALDELIKEVLILKQEEYETEETGRINPRFYHEVFTDTENLFQTREEKQIKTRVSLVFDVSGSMDGDRTILVLHAVNIIADAFNKALKQGAPGDMRIYAFADDVVEVYNNVDNYKPLSYNDIPKIRETIGGGTNLSEAVNHVVNEVNNDPEYKNIVVILTDSEVDDRELNTMANNISTGDVRVLYIAIRSSQYQTNAFKEIFGDNNITSKENAVPILEQVMFQGLRNVN